ncbi:MAG TPA: hypothetical protein VI874_00985, partial [Candidatus Norongarragalinales archaeon]|nr:hypothetical protein [Candidatus Norongarragalinales archaeon]
MAPKKDLKVLTTLFSLAVPYLAARPLLDLQESALGAGIFLTALEFIEIPDKLGENVPCTQEDMAGIKDKYRLAFVGSVATSVISIAVPFTTATGFFAQAWLGAVKILDLTQPADVYKWYLGDQAIAYTSNCKDTMHTILAFQKVPDLVATQSKNPIANIPVLNQLSTASILNPSDEEKKKATELEKRTEILNLKTTLSNQVGFFYTPELLFFHIKDSTHFTKSGAYDLIKGTCVGDFRLADKDGRGVTMTKDGLRLFNKDNELVADFHSLEWKIRAVTNTVNQQIARTIIPNKIVSSKLSGGDTVFLSISSTGHSTLLNPPCDLRLAIRELTGRDIGSDLTNAIGPVKAVQTEGGTIGILDNKVYFVNNAGATVTAPTPESLKKALSEGSRITVKNSGTVFVHGGDPKEQSAGTLKSILAENGQVLYDAANGRVDVIIYSLFETP